MKIPPDSVDRRRRQIPGAELEFTRPPLITINATWAHNAVTPRSIVADDDILPLAPHFQAWQITVGLWLTAIMVLCGCLGRGKYDMTANTATIKVADIRRMVLTETGADWFAILDRNLNTLARERGIELSEDIPFTSIALQAASRAGAHGLNDRVEVGLEALSRVVGRAPSTGGLLDNSKDYLRNTVLVSLIQQGKTEGKSLAEIKKDTTVKAIVEHIGVRDSTLQKYFDEKTLPNRLIRDMNEIGQRKTKARGSVFDEFNPSRKKDFKAFYRQVVQNEAATVLSERNRLKDRVIQEAHRFGDPEHGGLSEERHRELSVDEGERIESKFLAKRLKDELFKLNPRYLTVLHLLKDQDLDITDPADNKRFQKELGLPTRDQFVHFRDQFLSDLKRVFAHLDIGKDDAELALRAARKRADDKPMPRDRGDEIAHEIHEMIEAHFRELRQNIRENGIAITPQLLAEASPFSFAPT